MSSPGTSEATERFLKVQDLQLCVEDRGAGPVVLLAHGMWCDASMFHPLAQLLAPHARVVVPDFRAHGRSDIPGSGWSVSDLADDLAGILDQLAVPQVVLAGFSMGGMAAVEFALRYPRRLAGLVLMGTSASAEDLVRSAQIKALAKLIDLTGPARFLPAEAARSTFSAEYRRRHRQEVTRWESVVRAMPRVALTQALRAVGGRQSHLEQLDQITIPVAIVSGGADAIVRLRHSQMIHRRIPGSRLIVYPKAGHAVPLERPGEIAELIEQMLPRA